MTRPPWFTLTHDGDVHWANCTICGLQFEYMPGLLGKRRLLKWMAYHKMHHRLIGDVEHQS